MQPRPETNEQTRGVVDLDEHSDHCQDTSNLCLNSDPMLEPPSHVTDRNVLTAVRRHWSVDVDRVEHLPVGFGAHHWMASASGSPRFFATLDRLADRHTVDSLERAYASAAALADAGLEFVIGSVASSSGRFTVPLGAGRLSVVRWLTGAAAGLGPIESADLATANLAMLQRLHTAAPHMSLRHWRPLIDRTFPAAMTRRTAEIWSTGPYGERARAAIRGRSSALREWTRRYLKLADQARTRQWVTTHGEPHTANQMITDAGPVLVDWESVALAPRERDLRPLIDFGWADRVRPDWDMVEMFDLEWRLDEINQYAAWFSALHVGSASDEVAFAGLAGELDRPRAAAAEVSHLDTCTVRAEARDGLDWLGRVTTSHCVDRPPLTALI